MFGKRSFLAKFLILAGAALALFVGIISFGFLAAANDDFHAALFKTAYRASVSKSFFLESYATIYLDNCNAGYTLQPIDEFLISKLETTDSETEIAAITHFYVLRAGGREGFRIYKISDATKPKAIAAIMKRLDDYDSNRALKALILTEEIRTSESLGKGYLGSRIDRQTTQFAWWEKSGRAESIRLYKNWWNLNLDWHAKSAIDPLENSSVHAYYCCG